MYFIHCFITSRSTKPAIWQQSLCPDLEEHSHLKEVQLPIIPYITLNACFDNHFSFKVSEYLFYKMHFLRTYLKQFPNSYQINKLVLTKNGRKCDAKKPDLTSTSGSPSPGADLLLRYPPLTSPVTGPPRSLQGPGSGRPHPAGTSRRCLLGAGSEVSVLTFHRSAGGAAAPRCGSGRRCCGTCFLQRGASASRATVKRAEAQGK